MANDQLFGNKIHPACQYCTEAMQQMKENVLCIKKGIVSPNYSCKKFVYDPLKRIPPRPQSLYRYEAQDFSIT